jgi:alkylation response protein AidB-like acyl-CoA dehydrogenase
MATRIEASELLIQQASFQKNNGRKVTTTGAMAKYYASEVAYGPATRPSRSSGATAIPRTFPVEKFYRDSKLCTIGEGTSEIQKLVISRNVLKDDQVEG